MARKVSIDIVGDSVSAERAFLRTSKAAQGFSHSTRGVERDFSRMTRGVISGSGVFRSLGRSLAFASGGFLAFGSAAAAIRKSIDAAEETEKAFRGLGAQAKASGTTVTQAFASIGKLESPAANLGFNKTDLAEGLTVLIRGSGSLKKALTEVGAAEDVARAKGVTLAQGAFVVNRALISSGNSARSLGIHFPKAATEAQKLAIILQRFSGQARAQTTEQDRFNATLFNTEEIVGRTLLPVLNKYLASLGAWLTKMDQSGRLQRDVAGAVHDVTGAFHAVATVIKTLDRVTGSFTHTLEDLAAVWLVLKARTALIGWGAITSGLETTGAAAATATGEVSALSRALTGLKGLGPIAIAVGVTEFINFARDQAKHIATQNGPNFTLKGSNKQFALGGRGGVFGSGTSPLAPAVPGKSLNPFAPNIFGQGRLGIGALLGTKDAKKAFANAAKAAPHGTPIQGQFNLLELKLADAQRANNTVLQRSILVSEEKLLVQLEHQAKTLKDRTQLAQQAAGIADQIRAMDSASVTADKKVANAAKKAAAAAKKKADAARKAAEAFNVPLGLQVADARAQALGKSETAILNKIKGVAEKALKSGRLGLQGQLDAWNEIANINGQLKNSAASALNGFKQANVDKIARSVGLTGAMAKKLKAQLSQLGPGGTIPSKGVGAFGQIIGATGGPIIVHTHVHLGQKEVGRAVTRVQQKDRNRNPTQRRGPHAGGR